MKTNAARILDGLGIAYDIREYEVSTDEINYAEAVACAVGLPPEQVFKTLVVRGDRTGVALAVIPSNKRLDLKQLAQLSGDNKIDTVPLKDVQPLTGYVRGSVTALGCKKAYAVYADEKIKHFGVIGISGGAPGTELLLAPSDYLRAAKAMSGAITLDKP